MRNSNECDAQRMTTGRERAGWADPAGRGQGLGSLAANRARELREVVVGQLRRGVVECQCNDFTGGEQGPMNQPEQQQKDRRDKKL